MAWTPYYDDGGGRVIYHGDVLGILPSLPAASVDLIVADPPYFRVKTDWWDRQWDTAEGFLAWVGRLCGEFRRVLRPNGSLYVFASPRMAARVECKVGETFNVLNQVVWVKTEGRHLQQHQEALRSWFPQTERIVFAEQQGADATADRESGYTSQCEEAKRRVFGNYLRDEFLRAGVNYKEIAAAIGAHGKVNHGGSVSNWILGLNCPTPEQYQKIREWLNSRNGQGDYLHQEYQELHREYEDLRREYEDLRREYEDLRRPFAVTGRDPYTDVWDFPTVGAYPGKHPCEKPLSLLAHLVKASSREGATVLDPFCGSGVLAEVCRELGRSYIGVDVEERWVRAATHRLSQSAFAFPPDPPAPGLFDGEAGGP